MANSRSLQLARKSLDCMVSAIEVYNKPGFIYREELFCILVINAWEMLLKAKILKDNNNKLSSIQVRESFPTKDGEKSKRWKYKESRSGNKLTLDIFGCMRRLRLREYNSGVLYENLETIVEVRDNVVHFYNRDPLLVRKIQELGTANIKSYIFFLGEWFSLNVEKYNFYLMPLAFFPAKQLEPILLQRDVNLTNLLQYIAEKEKRFPSDPSSEHNITIAIETKMVKSNALDATEIRVTDDPSAPQVQIALEDLKKTYPLDYRELTLKLSGRYIDFKVNPDYHELRKTLEENKKYCYHYPLNPNNPDGATKALFSVLIFQEFDKYYQKK